MDKVTKALRFTESRGHPRDFEEPLATQRKIATDRQDVYIDLHAYFHSKKPTPNVSEACSDSCRQATALDDRASIRTDDSHGLNDQRYVDMLIRM